APAAQSPIIRPQRMPEIEDFPAPVQQQMRQRVGTPAQVAPAVHGMEQRRKSLLEKLASFGLNAKSDDQAPRHESAAPRVAISEGAANRAPQRAAPQRAAGALDPHGRVATPAARAADEDHLDIPAFLRRSS
ncbi:MAG: cell division protein FtsZ, partial [Hyphomicrobiales bacterium]|nr:cell division protein FtsZ [Hyphomicrobiales bacterium]